MYAEGKLNRNLEQVGGRIAVEKATSEMRLRNDEEIWYLPTIKSIPLRCKWTRFIRRLSKTIILNVVLFLYEFLILFFCTNSYYIINMKSKVDCFTYNVWNVIAKYR